MRDTGKQSSKPIKPSPNPVTLPGEPVGSSKDQEHGEGSYSGTRAYQASLKGYLEAANVEKDARAAAPDNAAQARDMEKAEKAGRNPAIKKLQRVKGK